MVGEIVVDRDRAAGQRHRPAHLQPPAHMGKAGQRLGRHVRRHPQVFGRRQGGQRIELVVRAAERPAHAGHRFAPAQHGKVLRIAFGGVVAVGGAEGAQASL